MKIAALLYPTKPIKIDEDSSVWILDELQKRGHKAYFFESESLSFENGVPHADLSKLKLDLKKRRVITSPFKKRVRLDSMDAVMIRKEPPFDNAYLYALHLLAPLVSQVFIFNNPTGVAMMGEKTALTFFPELTPKTLISQNPLEILEFVKKSKGAAVLKPLNEKGGKGVIRLFSRDPKNKSHILRMTRDGLEKIMVQQFINHEKSGDKRIVLLNGEILGAFTRIPPKHDFRANLSTGGSMHKTVLSAKDKNIAKKLKPFLLKHGLYFVGIDVLSGYLSEINVTSPAGIPELNELYGLKTQEVVADFIEKKVLKQPRRR